MNVFIITGCHVLYGSDFLLANDSKVLAITVFLLSGHIQYGLVSFFSCSMTRMFHTHRSTIHRSKAMIQQKDVM